jgi:multicomponent Na+:H+ antiporter subunit E
MKPLPINNRIAIFIISLITWLLMTSFTDPQEIIAGIIVALLVTWLCKILFSPAKIHLGFKKIYRLVIYFLILIWEMVKANFYMISLVLRPKLPVNSGIVKIKTDLRNDTALTILANSITLTSGTLTIDVDGAKGFLYIHCLQVPGRDMAGNTVAIGHKFEKRLRVIFE